MKKPPEYVIKKWLCENNIAGLRVDYKQTGTDTAKTYWDLMPSNGKPKRLLAETVKELVDVRPDWCSVTRVKDSIRIEIDKYDNFVAENADDFAAYKRLKKKFED